MCHWMFNKNFRNLKFTDIFNSLSVEDIENPNCWYYLLFKRSHIDLFIPINNDWFGKDSLLLFRLVFLLTQEEVICS